MTLMELGFLVMYLSHYFGIYPVVLELKFLFMDKGDLNTYNLIGKRICKVPLGLIKHLNTAEFLVCVGPNSTITNNPKVYTKRNRDMTIILQPCFQMCSTAPSVRRVYLFLLKWTVTCKNLEAYQIHRGRKLI